ncbi:hypothetical protein PTSG_11855 [Salpingoeca rosetta]|uniref:GAIN-B domain-containing protein n=1 Tax=Salpingoeca rosetta (strain ATCC 50818 / BSB-021) TaxID=946362 RepID=F2U1L9_SALR5|nr:uncharacterized protein PTSG_11855 [Salpingoeca rosetta]EGD81521.1 hypothetical protein PTSG_11855 [Salpingoeca rosetta]|eukprot:XP_004996725.1 hypothetical protein PTSG_11855 [Salpingoeca rosetta]
MARVVAMLCLLALCVVSPAHATTQLSIQRQCASLAQGEDCAVAREGDALSVLVSASEPLPSNVIVEITVDPIQTQTLESDDFFPMQAQFALFAGSSSASWVFVVESNDGPELNETFALRLSLLAPVSGVSIAQDAFTVTVPLNENPYGTIAFINFGGPSGPTVTSEGSALIAVIGRSGGRFGEQTVAWEIGGGEDDFALASGTLVFDQGDSSVNLIIPVINDDVPELQESFVLSLTQVVSGGASLSANSDLTSMDVVISANDYPLGSFSFALAELGVREKTGTASHAAALTIARASGALGTAQVLVETTSDASAVSAAVQSSFDWFADDPLVLATATPAQDYTPVSRVVTFAEGQTTATVLVPLSTDAVAEPNEAFVVTLALSGTAEGTAAARVFENSSMLVVIQASDVAGGQFQFQLNTATASSGASPVVVIAEPDEDALQPHVAIFNVTRTGAAFGEARLEWAATSNNTASAPRSGVLGFQPGQTWALLEFEVAADDIPEFTEEWALQLTRASSISFSADQAALGTSTTARVIVPRNDFPNGLLQLEDTASISLLEGSTHPLSVAVQRLWGTHGTVTVDWRVAPSAAALASASPDVVEFGSPADNLDSWRGTLVFEDVQTTGHIVIAATDDDIPELRQVFTLTLGNATNGAVISTAHPSAFAIDFAIEASDAPLGVFELGAAYVSVPEPSNDLFRTASVAITRTTTRGSVLVRYRILAGAPGIAAASRGVDYIDAVSALLFTEGQASQAVSVTVLHDDEPEADEALQLVLESVRPINQDLTHATALGNQTVCTVVIPANDMASGVFSFEQPDQALVVVREPEAGEQPAGIVVKRNAGAFGAVEVAWHLATSDAASFSTLNGTLTFEEAAINATLVVPIVPDDVPELESTHILTLTSISGGYTNQSAFAPQGTRKTIVVPASDDANGVLAIAPDFGASVTLAEPPSPGEEGTGAIAPSTLLVPVVRTRGAFGIVQAQWEIVPQSPAPPPTTTTMTTTAPPPAFVRSSGVVTFGDGVREASIAISVADDTLPELDAAFTLRLINATGGARLKTDAEYAANGSGGDDGSSDSGITNGTVALTVLASDDPYGVVGVRNDSLTLRVQEEDGSMTVFVHRAQGTVGRTTVGWELRSALTSTITALHPTSGVVVLEQGVASVPIIISIEDDTIPEYQDEFVLALTELSGGARFDAQRILASITLEASDFPHGLFSANITGASGAHVAFDDTSAPFDVHLSADGTVVPSVEQGTFTLRVIRAVAVSEPAAVTISVTRTFGTEGTVQVPVELIGARELQNQSSDDGGDPDNGAAAPNANYDYNQTASAFADTGPGGDVLLSTSSVIFEDGETHKQLVLSVLEDAVPEVTEVVWVVLGSPVLLETTATQPAEPAIMAGDVLQVAILENDDPYGRPELLSSLVVSSEGQRAQVGIVRRGGLFGSMRVTLHVLVNGTEQHIATPLGGDAAYRSTLNPTRVLPTLAGSDFSLSATASDSINNNSGTAAASTTTSSSNSAVSLVPVSVDELLATVVFAPGQQVAQVAFAIAADGQPELDEGFVVKLGSVVSGAGTLAAEDLQLDAMVAGAPTHTLVRIPENDNARGLFRFAPASLVLGLNTVAETNRTITLSVQRTVSTLGRLAVPFTVSTDGSGAAASLQPHNGSVWFEDGQSTSTLTLRVVDDSVPELEQVAAVTLGETPGASSIAQDASTAIVTILPNDDPHGVVDLAAAGVIASATHRNLSFTLARSGGLFSDIRARVRLHIDHNNAGCVSVAEEGLQEVVQVPFAEGQAVASANVPIPDTFSLSLAENTRFCVTVISVEQQDGTVVTTPQGVSPRLGPRVTTLVTPPQEARFGVLLWEYVNTTIHSNGTSVNTTRINSGEAQISVDSSSNGTRAMVTLAETGNTVAVLSVKRVAGSFGAVYLNVSLGAASEQISRIKQGESATLRMDDLTFPQQVVLAHGQTEAGFTLAPVDNTVPELPKEGTLSLTATTASSTAVSGTGSLIPLLPARRGSEGATVVGAGTVLLDAAVVVDSSDDAYGVLELVQPLGAVDVLRGEGNVTVTVQRSVGYYGDVVVQLAARATAAQRSTTHDLSRFRATVVFPARWFGEVTDGDAADSDRATVVVPLSASVVADIPDGQGLTVYIVNVTNSLGESRVVRDEATFVLRSCPECAVAFAPAPPTLLSLKEGAAFSATLRRGPSAYDRVVVQWAIEPDTGDIVPAAGTTTLEIGQTTASLAFTVVDDTVPELPEAFSLLILSARGAEISVAQGAAASLDIGIAANDNAYGLFSFAVLRSRVAEGGDGESSQATIRVQRLRGTEGRVLVDVDTADELMSLFSLPMAMVDVAEMLAQTQNASATTGDSSGNSTSTMDVSDVTVASWSAASKVEECASMCITNATVDCVAFGWFQPNTTSNSTTSNAADLNATDTRNVRGSNGAASTFTCALFALQREPTVGISDIADVLSEWTVYVRETYSTANASVEGLDYVGLHTTLDFAAGEAEKVITLDILDDELPEVQEQVFVHLSNARLVLSTDAGSSSSGNDDIAVAASDALGGALSIATDSTGNTEKRVVVIEESDDPYGRFAFASSIVHTEEGQVARIGVTRFAGTFEDTMVMWAIDTSSRATSHNDTNMGSAGLASAGDFAVSTGLNGTLVFASGVHGEETQPTLHFDVEITDDAVPELAESATLVLSIAPSSKGVLGQQDTAQLRIAHSDFPGGTVQYAQSRLELSEGDNATMHIVRTGGALVAVNASIVFVGVQHDARVLDTATFALADTNNLRISPTWVVFEEGQRESDVAVQVRDDTAANFNYTVRLGLSLPATTMDARMAQVQGVDNMGVIDIAVAQDDFPAGLFGLSLWHLKSTQHASQHVYVAAEDEVVTVTVTRDQGAAESVELVLSMADGTTSSHEVVLSPSTSTASVVPVSNGSVIVHFQPGERQVNVTARVVGDKVPEGAEWFELTLNVVSTTAGAMAGVRASAQTANVTVLPSDNAYDFGRFFIPENQVVREDSPAGGALRVVRSLGLLGEVDVTVRIRPLDPLDWFMSQSPITIPICLDTASMGPESNTTTTATNSTTAMTSGCSSKNNATSGAAQATTEALLNFTAMVPARDGDEDAVACARACLTQADFECAAFVLAGSTRDLCLLYDQDAAGHLVVSATEEDTVTSANTSTGATTDLGLLFVLDIHLHAFPTVTDSISSISLADLQNSSTQTATVRIPSGAEEALVVLPLADDTMPEGLELAVVDIVQCELVSPQGYTHPGAGPECVATPTIVGVAANDDVNGLFSLSAAAAAPPAMTSPSQGSVAVVAGAEGQRVQFDVQRSVSTKGTSTVCWMAMAVAAEQATSDASTDTMSTVTDNSTTHATGASVSVAQQLSPAEGCVVFAEGEMRVSFDVFVVDDAVPEIVQQFDVSLVNASGVASVTSGRNSTVRLEVEESDNPGGLVSVAGAANSTSARRISAAEGNVFNISVARSVAALKEILVEWEIVHAGSGIEADAPAVRFDHAQGNVTLGVGVMQAAFDVQLLDDGVPNVINTYALRLLRTYNGGELDTAQSEVAVVARPDDDRVAFEAAGAAILLSEDAADDGTVVAGNGDDGAVGTSGLSSNATVWVQRLDVATSGELVVTWALTGEARAQFLPPHTGQLTFFGAQTRRLPIHLELVSDTVPELAQQAVLRLTSVSENGVFDPSARQEVLLNVQSSDSALGVYELSQVEVDTTEGDSALRQGQRLSVVRAPGSGSLGTVRVHLEAISSMQDPARQRAVPVEDFVLLTTFVDLPATSDAVGVNIDVIDDTNPELAEAFHVRITQLEILSLADGTSVAEMVPPAVQSYTLPPEVGSLDETRIVIAENDNARGVFRIVHMNGDVVAGDGTVRVNEAAGVYSALLVRDMAQGGAFGNVTVHVALDFETATGASGAAGQFAFSLARTAEQAIADTAEETDAAASSLFSTVTSPSAETATSSTGVLSDWVRSVAEWPQVQMQAEPEAVVTFAEGDTLFAVVATRQQTVLYAMQTNNNNNNNADEIGATTVAPAQAQQVLSNRDVRSLATGRVGQNVFVFLPVFSLRNSIIPSASLSTLYMLDGEFMVPTATLSTVNPTCTAFIAVNNSTAYVAVGSDYNDEGQLTGQIKLLRVTEDGALAETSVVEGVFPTSFHATSGIVRHSVGADGTEATAEEVGVVTTVLSPLLLVASADSGTAAAFVVTPQGTLEQLQVTADAAASESGEPVDVSMALAGVAQWTHVFAGGADAQEDYTRALLIGVKRDPDMPPVVVEVLSTRDGGAADTVPVHIVVLSADTVVDQLGLPSFGVRGVSSLNHVSSSGSSSVSFSPVLLALIEQDEDASSNNSNNNNSSSSNNNISAHHVVAYVYDVQASRFVAVAQASVGDHVTAIDTSYLGYSAWVNGAALPSTLEAAPGLHTEPWLLHMLGDAGSTSVDIALLENVHVEGDAFLPRAVIEFTDGQTEAEVELVFLNDQQPEGEEALALTIVAVEDGARADSDAGRRSLRIATPANDRYYGTFSFSQETLAMQHMYAEPEDADPVRVLLKVVRTGPVMAAATVFWRADVVGSVANASTTTATATATATATGGGGGASALQHVLREMAGMLTFDEGEGTQTLVLTIDPDDIAEVAAQVRITLSSHPEPAAQESSDDAAVASVASAPHIDAERGHVDLVIAGSDNPRGGVFLETEGGERAITCVEGEVITLAVRRLPDAYDDLIAELALSPIGAGATRADISTDVSLSTVQLNSTQGQRVVSTRIRVLCVADGEDELEETFVVSLVQLSNPGVTLLHNNSQVRVTIAASGEPFGALHVASTAEVTLATTSNEANNSVTTSDRHLVSRLVTINVTRAGGTFGDIVAHISAAYSSDGGDNSFLVVEGLLDIAQADPVTILRAGEHAALLRLPLSLDAKLVTDSRLRITLTQVQATVPSPSTGAPVVVQTYDTFEATALVPESAAGGVVRLASPDLAEVAAGSDVTVGGVAGVVIANEGEALALRLQREHGRFAPTTASAALPATLRWRLSSVEEATGTAASGTPTSAVPCAEPRQGQVSVSESMDIVLNIPSDELPERDEVCLLTFSLHNATWVSLATELVALVVVANDNPAGTLYLERANVSSTNNRDEVSDGSIAIVTDLDTQTRTAVLDVHRAGGTFGPLTFSYRLVYAAPVASLFLDVSATTWEHTGTGTFASAQTTVRVQAAIPEALRLEVSGTLGAELMGVSLADGTTSASAYAAGIVPGIDATRSTAALSVTEGVFTYGRVSLDSDVVSAQESQGTVTLSLLRDTATHGDITVLWTVEEEDRGTSSSPAAATTAAAQAGVDFPVQSGEVTLASREVVASFSVALTDDDEPEQSESFIVRLTQVFGGAVLGRTTTRVVLAASDDAAGRFAFAGAGSIVVEEPSAGTAAATTPVQLTVQRSAGLFGAVSVFWQVTASSAAATTQSQDVSTDISPPSGMLEFVQGQQSAVLTLQVLGDSTPELQEVFVVSLTRLVADVADQGSIDDTARSVTIVVPPSDDPYGIVGMSAPAKVVQVAQRAPRFVVFDVLRSFGTVDQVVVTCVVDLNARPTSNSTTATATAVPTAQEMADLSSCPLANGVATISSDCVFSVTLSEGQARQSLQLDISDSVALVAGRTVLVRVASATVSSDNSGVAIDDSARGTAFAIPLEVADGTVGFEAALASSGLRVFESASTTSTAATAAASSRASLTLVRSGGSYVPGASGYLLVSWAIRVAGSVTNGASTTPIASTAAAAATATAGAGATDAVGDDVSPVSGVVAFAPGQNTSTLSFDILDDAIPEFEEVFVVELVRVLACPSRSSLPCVDAVDTPVVLTRNANSVVVTVAASDDPLGVVQFAEGSVALLVRNNQAVLDVERSGGLDSSFAVSYRAFRGRFDTLSVSIQGSVSLVAGQTAASIALTIPSADALGAGLIGNFTVELVTSNTTLQGARLGARRLASVTVVFADKLSSQGGAANTVAGTLGSRNGDDGTVCVVLVPEGCLGLSNADVVLDDGIASSTTCVADIASGLAETDRVCSDSLFFMHAALSNILDAFVGTSAEVVPSSTTDVAAGAGAASAVSHTQPDPRQAGHDEGMWRRRRRRRATVVELQAVAGVVDALLLQRQPQPWIDTLLRKFGAALLVDCDEAVDGSAGCSCCCTRSFVGERATWEVTRARPASLSGRVSSLPVAATTVELHAPPFLGDVLQPLDSLLSGGSTNTTETDDSQCNTLVAIAFAAQDNTFPVPARTRAVDGVLVHASVADEDLAELGPTNTFTFAFSPDSAGAGEVRQPRCAYWDEGMWLTDGCELAIDAGDQGTLECACTHMAHTYGVLEETTDPVPLVVMAGTGVVLAGCVLLLLTHLVWGRGRASSYRAQAFVSLFLAGSLFIIGAYTVRSASVDETLAFAAGMLTHYLLLVTLALATAAVLAGTREYCADLVDVSAIVRARSALLWSVLCWVVPAFIVAIYFGIALDASDTGISGTYGDVGRFGRMSFIQQEIGLYAAFVAPCSVAVLLTLFGLVRLEASHCRFNAQQFSIEQDEGISTLDALYNLRVSAGINIVIGLSVLFGALFSSLALVLWAVALWLLAVFMFAAVVITLRRQRHSGKASVGIPDALEMRSEQGGVVVLDKKDGRYLQSPSMAFQKYLDDPSQSSLSPAKASSHSAGASFALDTAQSGAYMRADDTTAEFDDLIAALTAAPGLVIGEGVDETALNMSPSTTVDLHAQHEHLQYRHRFDAGADGSRAGIHLQEGASGDTADFEEPTSLDSTRITAGQLPVLDESAVRPVELRRMSIADTHL